jgi:hypothetical protein
MTKTTIPVLIPLAAVAAMAAPPTANAAFAQFELNCGPATVEVGDSGKNGVVRSHVVRTYSGWRVDHTLADGQTVSRGVQYRMQDLSPPGRFLWGGRLDRNPNLFMYGEVTQANNDRFMYDERLYDNAQQNKVVMHSTTWCDGAGRPIAPSLPLAHSQPRCPATHGDTEPDRPDADLPRLWSDNDVEGPDRECLLSPKDALMPPLGPSPLPPASPTAANSIELSCIAPTVFVGDADRGPNPVVAVSVRTGYRQWRIRYTFADGTHVNREDQYSLSDASTDSSTSWAGSLRSNPTLRMIGDILIDGPAGGYFYRERIQDDTKGGQIIVDMVASCYRLDQRPPAVASTPSISSPDSDSVPIYPGARGRAAYVDVSLGTTPVRMLIDTGATSALVSRSIAAVLVSNDEAVLLPFTAPATMANGSTIQEQIISIRAVTIGRHTLHNVIAGVAPDGADMLLGFPVLNQVGRFTIDTNAGQLIFG